MQIMLILVCVCRYHCQMYRVSRMPQLGILTYPALSLTTKYCYNRIRYPAILYPHPDNAIARQLSQDLIMNGTTISRTTTEWA